jgi:hypothetical protein
MPYTVVISDDGRERRWSEPNKDEVIDRLMWLLRQHEYEMTIIYPDGSRY